MKKNRRRAVLFLRDEREDIFVGDGVPDVPSAQQRRAVIARREAPRQSVPLPQISPSKSQQFPAKFCAPIQNVEISPETVAQGAEECYILTVNRIRVGGRS